MRLRLNKRAQSTLEYALLIGVIVAGLIAMQMYLKRGYQGRLRESTDQIGEQYSPEHTASTTTITKSGTTTETVLNKVTKTVFSETDPDKTTIKSGSIETVTTLSDETF